MCHMTADSLDELHIMAAKIGMQRRWFQTPPKASHPHYDIPEDKRGLALSHGAVEVCPRTALHFAARLGLEWSELTGHHHLKDKYTRTLDRTQRYAVSHTSLLEPQICHKL